MSISLEEFRKQVKDKRGKPFLNKDVIEWFIEMGYDVVPFNNGSMYKVGGKVDVFTNSPKIYIANEKRWQLTTRDSIIQLIVKNC